MVSNRMKGDLVIKMAIAFRSPAKVTLPIVAINIAHTAIRRSCANMDSAHP